MSTVGIKDLKVHLGRYVSRAASGETITVTERGVPVAVLGPLSADRVAIDGLKRTGRIRGRGAKPLGLHVKVKRKMRRDPDLAGAVIEGRNR
jgi:prevent-host-death family protein